MHWWNKKAHRGLSSKSFTANDLPKLEGTFVSTLQKGFDMYQSLLKNVQITNMDFADVMKNASTDSFVYLDPPYYNMNNAAFYDACVTPFDHSKLLECVKSLPCDWGLSYDVTPEIAEMYSFANIQVIQHVSRLSYKLCDEYFITNRDIQI